MLITGTLVYDPKTYAVGEKRAAIVRAHVHMLAHLVVACRYFLRDRELKNANVVATQIANDPYVFRVTKTRAPATTAALCNLVERVVAKPHDSEEWRLLKHYWDELQQAFILNEGNHGWAILQVPGKLIEDTLWDLNRQGIKLAGSMWGPHVSVVRGERVRPELWKYLDGHKFSIEVGDQVRHNNKYYWFDCRSKPLEQVRLEMGLPPRPSPPFHLTIGFINNDRA